MNKAKALSPLVLIIAVMILARFLVPFEVVIIGLYVLGVVMSGLFVFTWFPLAFRALAHHRRDVSLLRIIDYAGLQLIVFLAFLLILRNVHAYGIQAPQDELAAFGRAFLPLMLDCIIGLRLYKWMHRLWENRHLKDDGDLIAGVQRDAAQQ